MRVRGLLIAMLFLSFTLTMNLATDGRIPANPIAVNPVTRVSETVLPTFAAILDSMEAQFKRIQDYQTTIDMVLDVKGFHIPPMSATVYFKQPDKLHFEARGFALLPRNAVMMTPELLRKLAQQVEVRTKEQLDKRSTYHVVLKPEEKDKNIEVVVDVWIDAERWVVLKVRTESNRFGWMEVVNQYDQVDHQFWLLKQSRVQMEIQKEIMQRMPRTGIGDADRREHRNTLLDEFFGTGQMFISFRNYKVNQGLADELFQEEKK